MLKHIPRSFTPELLKLLMEAGHGEGIIISDGNFPHKSLSRNAGDIYIPTHDITDLLRDILYFFPLDTTVDAAAFAMESVKESQRYDEYSKLIEENGSKLACVERFQFYDLAREAIGMIITSDMIKGGNILIKKGVVSNAGN